MMIATNADRYSRAVGAVLVVSVHIILIYLLATSLGFVEVPKFIKPMQAIFISEPEQRTQIKPIITKPQLSQPTLQTDIPTPVPEIEVPVEAPEAPTSTVANVEPITAENLQVSRRVEPTYPSASRRGGEEGTAVVRVLVSANGQPGQIVLDHSSGFARLDQAAMDAIRRWLFKAAERDGHAVDAWTTVRVTFRLDGSA